MRLTGCFLLLTILFAAISSTAEAAIYNCPNFSAFRYCKCLMYGPSANNLPPLIPVLAPSDSIAVPIYRCFTDTTMAVDAVNGGPYPRGLIPYTTYKALKDSTLGTVFRNIIYSMLSVAVVLFGLKIYTGQMQNVKMETFVLLLRVCVVAYFLYHAHEIYIGIYAIIPELTDMIANSMSGVRAAIPATLANAGSNANFWNNCYVNAAGATVPPNNTDGMWGMWDCTFNYLLGFTGASKTWSGLLTLATLFFTSLGTGVVIFFLMTMFIKGLLKAFLRFMQTYLLSVLGFSFMFIVGYIFVPLIVFNFTRDRFEKWLNTIISFMLTPAIMMGFMCMMLVMTDVILFTGKNSLYEKIYTGTSTNAAYQYPNSPIPEVTKYNMPDATIMLPEGYKGSFKFMTLMQTDNANKSATACSGTTSEGGMLPASMQTQQSGSNSIANTQPTTANIGMNYPTANIGPCIFNAVNPGPGPATGDPMVDKNNQIPPGCTPHEYVAPPLVDNSPVGMAYTFGGPAYALPTDTWKYISGILYASAVAALMVFIMNSIYDFLPKIVNGLVDAGGGQAGKLMQSKLPMEGSMDGALNNAYKAAQQASSKIESSTGMRA